MLVTFRQYTYLLIILRSVIGFFPFSMYPYKERFFKVKNVLSGTKR